LEIVLINEIGEVILSQTYHVFDHIFEASIDLEYINPAMYTLKVITNQKVFNVKIVKQ